MISLPAGHEIAKMLVHFGEDPRLCTPFRDAYFEKRVALSHLGQYWDDTVPLMDTNMIGDDFLEQIIEYYGYDDI